MKERWRSITKHTLSEVFTLPICLLYSPFSSYTPSPSSLLLSCTLNMEKNRGTRPQRLTSYLCLRGRPKDRATILPLHFTLSPSLSPFLQYLIEESIAASKAEVAQLRTTLAAERVARQNKEQYAQLAKLIHERPPTNQTEK